MLLHLPFVPCALQHQSPVLCVVRSPHGALVLFRSPASKPNVEPDHSHREFVFAPHRPPRITFKLFIFVRKLSNFPRSDSLRPPRTCSRVKTVVTGFSCPILRSMLW